MTKNSAKYSPSKETEPSLEYIGRNKPLLSYRASVSLNIIDGRYADVRPSEIEALMQHHRWTALRAWRHWTNKSKSEMASYLGMHTATYEYAEDGEVELGTWVLPALELACSDLADMWTRD